MACSNKHMTKKRMGKKSKKRSAKGKKRITKKNMKGGNQTIFKQLESCGTFMEKKKGKFEYIVDQNKFDLPEYKLLFDVVKQNEKFYKDRKRERAFKQYYNKIIAVKKILEKPKYNVWREELEKRSINNNYEHTKLTDRCYGPNLKSAAELLYGNTMKNKHYIEWEKKQRSEGKSNKNIGNTIVYHEKRRNIYIEHGVFNKLKDGKYEFVFHEEMYKPGIDEKGLIEQLVKKTKVLEVDSKKRLPMDKAVIDKYKEYFPNTTVTLNGHNDSNFNA